MATLNAVRKTVTGTSPSQTGTVATSTLTVWATPTSMDLEAHMQSTQQSRSQWLPNFIAQWCSGEHCAVLHSRWETHRPAELLWSAGIVRDNRILHSAENNVWGPRRLLQEGRLEGHGRSTGPRYGAGCE